MPRGPPKHCQKAGVTGSCLLSRLCEVFLIQTTKLILLSIFTITPEYADPSQGTACGLHSCSSAVSWISLLSADSASQSDFLLCFPDALAGVDLLNEVASLSTTISYCYCICLRHCLDLVPRAEGIVFRKNEFNKFLLVLLLSQPLSLQPLKAKCFPSSLEEVRGYC